MDKLNIVMNVGEVWERVPCFARSGRVCIVIIKRICEWDDSGIPRIVEVKGAGSGCHRCTLIRVPATPGKYLKRKLFSPKYQTNTLKALKLTVY